MVIPGVGPGCQETVDTVEIDRRTGCLLLRRLCPRDSDTTGISSFCFTIPAPRPTARCLTGRRSDLKPPQGAVRQPHHITCVVATPRVLRAHQAPQRFLMARQQQGGTRFARLRGTLKREASPCASLAPRGSPPGHGGAADRIHARGEGGAVGGGARRLRPWPLGAFVPARAGTTTVAAVGGMATFADLRVDRPGTYTLVATAPRLTAATSASFTVHVTFAAVSAGGSHTCAITPRGAAYCWGSNSSGQLGDGTRIAEAIPVLVSGGIRFATISLGENHTCGVATSGAAYCWGANFWGQLGDGTGFPQTSPARVAGGLDFTVGGAGATHTGGVTTSGAGYCWGDNFAGQLGDGRTGGASLTPVAVVGGLTFMRVSAGAGYRCGLTTGGVASCWGSNSDGRLGDGTTLSRPVPGLVAGVTGIAAVSAGARHACAVITGGTAYCWGANNTGQLGDGTTTSRAIPVPVWGGLTFNVLDGGGAHSCGVIPRSAPYCWGDNTYGQLGDGTGAGRAPPAPVADGLAFVAASAGLAHACGLTAGGTAYCWGANYAGQRGDGTTTLSPTPVRVAP